MDIKGQVHDETLTDATIAANTTVTLQFTVNPQFDFIITKLNGVSAATNVWDLLCNIKTQDNVELFSQNTPFHLVFPPHSSPPNYLEPAILVPGGNQLRLILQNTTVGAITTNWVVFHGYYVKRK